MASPDCSGKTFGTTEGQKRLAKKAGARIDHARRVSRTPTITGRRRKLQRPIKTAWENSGKHAIHKGNVNKDEENIREYAVKIILVYTKKKGRKHLCRTIVAVYVYRRRGRNTEARATAPYLKILEPHRHLNNKSGRTGKLVTFKALTMHVAHKKKPSLKPQG